MSQGSACPILSIWKACASSMPGQPTYAEMTCAPSGAIAMCMQVLGCQEGLMTGTGQCVTNVSCIVTARCQSDMMNGLFRGTNIQRRQLIRLEVKFGLHALRGAVLATSNTAAAPYLLHGQCVCVCDTAAGAACFVPSLLDPAHAVQK